jgi:hypothetical protein
MQGPLVSSQTAVRRLRIDQARLWPERDCNYDYTLTLLNTADYLITIARPAGVAGTSTYKLTVTVR